MKLGILGENIAFRYLNDFGYKIISRNYRRGFDEIDIIAFSPSGILIFLEVKTMKFAYSSSSCLIPEDNFSSRKVKKILRACEGFLIKNPSLLNEYLGWRMDLIAISIKEEKNLYNLHHYKNVGNSFWE